MTGYLNRESVLNILLRTDSMYGAYVGISNLEPLIVAEPIPRWIPVTERLPDEGQEVLVAGELKYKWETSLERFVDIGMLQDRKPYRPDMPIDFGKWSTINDWYEGQDIYRITHWMPIPKHPKERES